MQLRHLLLLLMGGVLAACSSSDEDVNGGGSAPATAIKPSTEVYVGVKSINAISQIASVRAEETELLRNAYFFVRVDPSLGIKNTKGETVPFTSTSYYPLKANDATSVMESTNTGKVYVDYPYLSLYGDHSTLEYCFSKDGSATANAIAFAPDMKSVLETVKSGTDRAYIDLDEQDLTDEQREKLHIIWYVVKHVSSGDKEWHVDGVLTDKDNIDEIGQDIAESGYMTARVFNPLTKNVEVDIFQQEHKDWGQIKTSIHVKEAQDITIVLPLDSQYVVEQDDFAIKEFEVLYPVTLYNTVCSANVNVVVEHNPANITITITGITDELLAAIESRYEDGLTVEINSYTKFDKLEEVWEQLKGSTVVTKAPVKGRIGSAYHDGEDIDLTRDAE